MKRWYRDKKKGKLGGLCAGLSDMWNVDVTLVRFIWVATIWTPFPGILGYLIAWFIVPDKEELHATTIVDTTTPGTNSNKEFLAG